MSDPALRRWSAPIATILLLGTGLLAGLRSISPFPVANDHAYFLPPSFVAAAGGPLANPWMASGFDQRLDWHGFLQPWLVGLGARLCGGGWDGVHLAIDGLAAAVFVAVVVVAVRIGLSIGAVITVGLTALALLLDARSRPEVLATAETVLLVALYAGPGASRFASRGRAVLAGVVLGATLVTHPVVFGLAGLGLTAAAGIAVLRGELRLGAAVVVAGIAAAAAVAAVFALTHLALGIGPADWFAGIRRAGQAVLERTDHGGFVKYQLANRFLPGAVLGFVLVGAVIVAARRGLIEAGRVGPTAATAVAAVLAGVAGVVLYRFALRVPATYYNFSGVLVAVMLLALRLVPAAGWERRIGTATATALAAAAVVGVGVWTVQAAGERGAIGETRGELTTALRADLAAGRTICSDSAALAAVDDVAAARRLIVSIPLSDGPAPPDPARCEIYYRVQTQEGDASPPEVGGFRLDRDAYRRAAVVPKVRPFHLGFARYTRDRGT